MRTMTAHGVTLTIERHANDGRPYFEIKARNYRAVFPEHGCERTVCAGRCPVAGKVVPVKDRHNAQVCHGDLQYGMHFEHVEIFAGKVLETFAPAARKPWTPGELTVRWSGKIPADVQTQIDIALAERKAQGLRGSGALKVPNVGAARDPYYFPKAFLPIDGEETVSALHATDGRWVVLCDSLRCRDEQGHVTRVNEWAARSLADSAAERHRKWHKDMREGVSDPIESQAWTLRLTVDEIQVGDWYYTDCWHRIATIQTWRTGTDVAIWGDDEKRIATLSTRYDYLIVRSVDGPDWTPTPEARRSNYVSGAR